MLLAALLLLQAAPQCAATDAALPVNLAGWVEPVVATALVEGKPTALASRDWGYWQDVPAGSKPGKVVRTEFRIDKAGRYGVALDQRGWIDVVPGAAGGEALKSVVHGHGPECSTIRKIVRFDLQPGMYRLYLTGLDKPAAKVMLVAE